MSNVKVTIKVKAAGEKFSRKYEANVTDASSGSELLGRVESGWTELVSQARAKLGL
jgi:hypothetical protein